MTKTKSVKSYNFNITFGGTGLTARALFARHLALMLKAGITITEALDIARDSATGRMKKIIVDISRLLSGGQSFSNALTQYPDIFSGLFINSVRAGESSGTLAESLENIANQLEKERDLRAKIQSGMTYPLVVLVATIGLGFVLAFWILPKITPLFSGLRIDLPLTTRILLWTSDLIQSRGLVVAGFVFVLMTLVILFFRLKIFRPASHSLILHLPLIKTIIKEANLSRIARTLGTLLKSGLPINEALTITGQTAGNYHYAKKINKIRQSVNQGQGLADSFKSAGHLFPNLFVKMIKVGEESGQFEETLKYLADFYETEVDRSTKRLSTAIEPVLLLVIGLIVGVLALSIITPIYEITGNIRR